MQCAADARDILRLVPGTDLRDALERYARRPGRPPAMLLAGIGSLEDALIRPAGRNEALHIGGDLEIVALAGTLARAGIHVRIAIADAQGRVIGGHLLRGCRIRTTAELLMEPLRGVQLRRTKDPQTGYQELEAQRRRNPARRVRPALQRGGRR